VNLTRFFIRSRTIVGTEAKVYTFYIPSYVDTLDAPVTPFPTLVKYLPPGQAAEVTDVDRRYQRHQFTTISNLPMVTL
jgi:hypothetical protein